MKVTLLYTYYEAPLMLEKQIEYWMQYSVESLYTVDIVVVDDGSSMNPASDIMTKLIPGGFPITLYRIKEDIPQNTVGARNLGFAKALYDWVFNLDIDHVLNRENVNDLADLVNSGSLCGSCYHIPKRKLVTDNSFKDIFSHSDSFLIKKDKFWEIGGYDESYVGYYHNGPCSIFRRALEKKSTRKDLDIYTLLFGPDIIADSSPLLNERKQRLKEQINVDNYNPKDPLRFDWEEVNIHG